MNDLFFEIKNFVYETGVMCLEYLRRMPKPTAILGLAVIILLFLRRMSVRKIFSFLVAAILLFVVLVRLETILTARFGEEASQIGIAVTRTVFVIMAGVILLYHSIKE
jgi:hypothetical protein